MKVILYGLGEGCDYVRSQLLESTEIVAYSDSFAEIKSYQGKRFVQPQELKKQKFDYIVITVIDLDIAWGIVGQISREYKIEKEKLIPYFGCCNTELYINKVGTRNLDEVENFIFGNSLAQRGFIERAFPTPTINFATVCTDLFIIFQTFKKVFKKSLHVKRVIIDLFDYHYFNIDSSRSYWSEWLWKRGAILVSNNLRKNKVLESYGFKDEQEALIFYMKTVNQLDITRKSIMSKIFRNKDTFYGINSEDAWLHIDKDAPLDKSMLLYKLEQNVYKDTYRQNIKMLHEIIEILDREHIEVILTMLPQYFEMEKVYKAVNDKWKEPFYAELGLILNKFNNVRFLNFKNESEISENHNFYFDAIHLNTSGGYAITDILIDKIY